MDMQALTLTYNLLSAGRQRNRDKILDMAGTIEREKLDIYVSELIQMYNDVYFIIDTIITAQNNIDSGKDG